MRITGVTVCVDYADFLAAGLKRWHTGLDRLLVVTTARDAGTRELCRKHNVETYSTDIFYANGAAFNKGAALSEACAACRIRPLADGWMLNFDADIVPPMDWRDQLEGCNLQPGTLYGTLRYKGKLNPDGTARKWKGPVLATRPDIAVEKDQVVGFFSLFHALDPILPVVGPLYDMCWSHAANYDTYFTLRWPRQRRRVLKMGVLHLGAVAEHWCGRNNAGAMSRLLRGDGTPGSWERIKMTNPPVLLANLVSAAGG